jgi:RNA recognition motif-containing protein
MMDAAKVGSSSPHPQSPSTVKLFVGGLTGEMTREMLAKYFSDYAEVVDSFVVYENQKPSGFGFITVNDKRSADRILQSRHILNNSLLDVKPALDRAQAKDKEESDRRRKIFVGGLPKNFPDECLKVFFEKFGTVQKCYVVKDTMTGKTRGFGFVIFSTDEGYLKALENPNLVIGGNDVHVKAATTKQDQRHSKQSVNTLYPSTKKSKNPKNLQGDTNNEGTHYSSFINQREKSPINSKKVQFQASQPPQAEDYDPHGQSHYDRSYYVNWVGQAPIPQYVPYQTAPMIPQQHSMIYTSSPFQYPLQPVQQQAAFYSPKHVHSLDDPVQSGHRLQLYPINNRQIYYEPVTQKSMVFKPSATKLHSAQAVPYRPQGPAGGSMVNPFSTPTPSQPVKSAHLIGLHPRHFNHHEVAYVPHSPIPQKKYTQNPFGAQEDEDDDYREELKRAGDF